MDKFEILNLNGAAKSIVNRPGGSQGQLEQWKSVSRVLEHSKIIGARKLTKNDGDHARPNF